MESQSEHSFGRAFLIHNTVYPFSPPYILAAFRRISNAVHVIRLFFITGFAAVGKFICQLSWILDLGVYLLQSLLLAYMYGGESSRALTPITIEEKGSWVAAPCPVLSHTHGTPYKGHLKIVTSCPHLFRSPF